MKRITPTIFSQYGRLLVLFASTERKHHWVCWCSCGNLTEATKNSLRMRDTRSCGCLAHEAHVRLGKGKATHGLHKSSEFTIWIGMKSRCNNPNEPHFADYGGRGICVYPGWVNDFPAFYAYMGPRPSSKHSLDRIDNNGNYEPGNVRWATKTEQQANKRNTLMVNLSGENIPMVTVARKYGINYRVLWSRLKYSKQTIEEAIRGPRSRKRLQ